MVDGMVEELAAHLKANGVGTIGWATGATGSTGTAVITHDALPDPPGQFTEAPTVALFQAPGLPGIKTYRRGRSIVERPILQVLYRSTAPPQGGHPDTRAVKRVAVRVEEVLDAIANQAIQGGYYLAVQDQAPAAQMQRDEAGRVILRQQFDVWRTPSTST